MGLKHVGANSVTSVTAYVILYSYIQVHKLVQIESVTRHLILTGIYLGQTAALHITLIKIYLRQKVTVHLI